MGLLDIFGGGAGSADDPYADILTPAQRNQMQVQGLLAMAGAFAQAGMPSRLPVPFGSALGSAAAALGTGQEAGMKTAIENALAAQKVRDLRAKAALQGKLSPIYQNILDRIRSGQGTDGAGVAPVPSAAPGTSPGGSGSSPGAASPAAPAAGGLLMMDRSLLYPDAAGGGLLGSDVGAEGEYGAGQKVGGLLGPGPAASVARMPTPLATAAPAASPDAAAAEVARLDAAYAARNPQADAAARAAVHTENVIAANRLPTERGGSSSGAPAEPDPGAGGDTPWGPTFAQGGAAGAPARGGGQTYWSPEGLAALHPTEGRYDQIHYPSGYTREGVKSSASGAYGFIDPTWRQFAGPDIAAKWPRAYMAPPAVQDAVAAITPVGHWTGVDAQGRPFNANAQRLAANPALVSGEPVAGPTAGGGEDAGWGPTFAQGAAEPRMPATTGGPDRVIPSGAGGPPAATLAQYAPGAGGGAPGGGLSAPGTLPQLAAPGTLPRLPPPGAAPGTPGAGGKIPGLNMTPQELAVIDAMAESAGLGNPFKGLLDTYYKSPGYLQESAGAQERGRIAESEPSQLRIEAVKARNALLQEMSKNAITLDQQGNVVEIPGMRQMLGLTAAAVEKAKQEATSQFQTVEATVLGPNGERTPQKMTQYEFTYREQQRTKNAAMGLPPQPGDIVSAATPESTKSSELGVTAGWKALQDTHAAEIAANRSDQQLGQIAEAMRGFTPGKTAEWRLTWGQYLKDAGFKIDGVSDGEIMQQAQRRLQLAAANVHEGSVSNFERGIYGETVTQLTNTPEGIVKAIGIQQRLNDYDRKVAQIHRDTIVNGVPNVVEAESRIAKLGPPLSPGELSALQEIRAGQVPGKGQAARPAPAIGTVQDGHSFKGGNPADPNNWQKVP